MSATRRLPAQPNLEQLRKQAKDLLAQYLSADPEAIAEVQRFERNPDPSSFALNDAQRVLARAYGYPSWPKLKAFVDGANVANLAVAVQSGNFPTVRTLLHARPELVHMDMHEGNEHRALHFAVLRRDSAMVRLLMEAGADARKGIYPHRDATSALALARERDYHDIVAVIEEEERLRRQELSCPNATISPVQEQINKAIAQAGNALAIQLLDADKTLIQACDRHGGTPLHIAAEESNQEIAQWLLDRRANVHKRDLRGLTPLDRAALHADDFPALANILLSRGAELTLFAAVALGNAARVRECLAADPAALRRIDHNGGLLTLAVNRAQIEIVELLLDLGADVDERIQLEQLEEPVASWGMPLWHAAGNNNLPISRLLLDRGADPNANVYASGRPLSRAWNHQDDSVKRLLLERGAQLQPHMISQTHDIAAARRLLENDSSEVTVEELLWPAAEYGCPEIVELTLPLTHVPLDSPRWHWVLIQPIRGATSQSPKGNYATMTLLLRHGINPNVSRYGQTPLHFAAAYTGRVPAHVRARMAALLLDYGAKLDVRDDLLQSTPLAWACRWGRKELAELLIARGAPLHEPGAQPWATPLAWAQKMNHPELLKLLTANPQPPPTLP